VTAQDHPKLELIVIDDGSTDNSVDVIEAWLKRASSPRSELHPQQNRGAHTTINRGLELAHGEYLTILNSDDYYYPNRLSSLLKFIRETNREFAFSEVDHVGTDGNRLADSNSVKFGYVNAPAALARHLRGLPKETRPLVHSETEAEQLIDTMHRSLSWKLTAPMRRGGRLFRRPSEGN
jgi:glycosyltransferase involved in cell wall biosynthesis